MFLKILIRKIFFVFENSFTIFFSKKKIFAHFFFSGVGYSVGRRLVLRFANWMAYEEYVHDPGDVTRLQRYLCGLKWNDHAVAEIKKICHLKALGLFFFSFFAKTTTKNVSGQPRKRWWTIWQTFCVVAHLPVVKKLKKKYEIDTEEEVEDDDEEGEAEQEEKQPTTESSTADETESDHEHEQEQEEREQKDSSQSTSRETSSKPPPLTRARSSGLSSSSQLPATSPDSSTSARSAHTRRSSTTIDSPPTIPPESRLATLKRMRNNLESKYFNSMDIKYMQNISFLDVQIEDLEIEIARKKENILAAENESVFL